MIVSPFVFGKTPSNIEVKLENNLRILEDKQNVPKGHGLFRILHQDFGDKRLIWDVSDFSQIAEARQIFKDLIAEGFVPYIIDKITGEPTNMPMANFDPMAEEVFMEEREIIMSPMHSAVGG